VLLYPPLLWIVIRVLGDEEPLANMLEGERSLAPGLFDLGHKHKQPLPDADRRLRPKAASAVRRRKDPRGFALFGLAGHEADRCLPAAPGLHAHRVVDHDRPDPPAVLDRAQKSIAEQPEHSPGTERGGINSIPADPTLVARELRLPFGSRPSTQDGGRRRPAGGTRPRRNQAHHNRDRKNDGWRHK
jgi:hypothetical protein